VHPINIKRSEFGIFSHIYPDLLEDEEKLHGFFSNEARAILPPDTAEVERNYENKTPTI
jgi:hypothetical protein